MQKNRKKHEKNRLKNNINAQKHDSIFDYETEIPKITKARSKTQKTSQEENYIGIAEPPKVDKKKIKKLKKRKQKEYLKKQKEIIKSEKKEEKINKTKSKNKNIKQPTVEQIKRIKQIKFIVKNLFFIVILITGIILLLLSPIFNTSKIEVVGNSKISAEEVMSLSQLNTGENIFKLADKTIIQNIKENPYINSVKIKRKLPSTISIIIEEREAEYMLEFGSSYAYIDKQGYILEISDKQLSNKIKIIGYETSNENIKAGNKLCDNDIDKLIAVELIMNSAYNNSISTLVTSININDESNYIIYMESERKTIYIGDKNNIDTKMLYIKKILEKEKENEGEIYVNMDFRIKNPYFKQKV